MSSQILVYEHPLSPYAQKVKLALLFKGLDFETKHLGLLSQEDQVHFLKLSPRMEVPLLVHAGHHIHDSSIILEYIEERWPTPTLLPSTPSSRAQARMLEDTMDTHFEANTWGMSEVIHFSRAQGKLAEQLKTFAANEIKTWFTWLDAQLHTKAWFNGQSYGWADICVVPFVNGASRFDLIPNENTELFRWWQATNQHPHVQQCKQAADGAELDAAVMTAALANGFKREYRDHRLEWMIRAGGFSVVEKGLQNDNLRFHTPF